MECGKWPYVDGFNADAFFRADFNDLFKEFAVMIAKPRSEVSSSGKNARGGKHDTLGVEPVIGHGVDCCVQVVGMNEVRVAD